MVTTRGRFAPSPTGPLHLGNARTALFAWLAARQHEGCFFLRMEDLDQVRCSPAAEAQIVDDLRWLGLTWDRPDPPAPHRQSERLLLYHRALTNLLEAGRAFPCACSRADVMRAVAAPHAEDDGWRYPGTCRDRPPQEVIAQARQAGRRPVMRFRGDGRRFSFHDRVHGPVDPAGQQGVDDFVLQRADGVIAYQLAVVVDDAEMQINQVVRGDDLLPSTPRQLALYEALQLSPPEFAHVPLVRDPGGDRLAKRRRPPTVAQLRATGISAEEVVGRLAASGGLCAPGERRRPEDLLAEFSLVKLGQASARLEYA